MRVRLRPLHRGRLIILAALAAVTVTGTACQPRVIIGELQNVTVDVPAGHRLDVKMWPRTLDGDSVWTRCADMGGYYLPTSETCIDVDF